MGARCIATDRRRFIAFGWLAGRHIGVQSAFEVWLILLGVTLTRRGGYLRKAHTAFCICRREREKTGGGWDPEWWV